MPQVTSLILLPLFFNPDDPEPAAPIPDDLFVQTGHELAERFGGATLHVHRDAPPRGFWWSHGVIYQDELAVVEVDIDDTPEARIALKSYVRTVLIPRFRQKAIYVRFVRVEGTAVADEAIGP